MKKLIGKAGAWGYSTGYAHAVRNEQAIEKKRIQNTDAELKRLANGISSVCEKISAKKAGLDKNSSDILEVQIALLQDEAFGGRIRQFIENEAVNAEYAVRCAGSDLAEEFSHMDNTYMRERSADIRGITSRLIKELKGEDTEDRFSENTILVVEELTPEYVSSIDRSKVSGVVSRNGAKTSHAAILCGNYGIPYLYGIDISQITEGMELAIDGESAELYLEPDRDVKDRIIKERAAANQKVSLSDVPDRIKIMANIGSPEDLFGVLQNQAEGIGLYRSEFLYMGANLPTEEEQYLAYKTVAEAMNGKETVIRTMDIGADKKASCMILPKEENPALGRRAIRICLEEPELFRTQLRALMRAACHGNISIMYPMITSVKELEDIQEQINLAEQELKIRGEQYRIPAQGIMIETPAAAIMSDVLADHVEFFSIGTNDLTQYTLAVDRVGEGLERFYDPYSEAVMRLIEIVVQNAHKKGVRVGICGELGGDAKAIPRLYQMGVDELSMSASKINGARRVLASLTSDEKVKEKKTRRENDTEVYAAPANGTLVKMEDIPDPAFSEGSLGRCVAVDPEDGDIYAPCDGCITMIAQTKHAIGIRTAGGRELLLHVGIDTVTLNGKGFDVLVEEQAEVHKGDLLMRTDLDVLRQANLSPLVIMAVGE